MGWTILLKDYLGASRVSFIFTDHGRCTKSPIKAKTIHLDLADQETLDQLLHRVEQKLVLEEDHEVTDQTPLLRSHLCISDTGSDIPDGDESGGSWQREEVDLTLKCTILADGCSVQAAARSSSSSKRTRRLLRQFQTVMQQIHLPGAGAELVSKIGTASDSDVREIWKRNANMPGPVEGTALDIFSDHVRLTPDGLAVHAWDGDMTYQELDKLSTVLSLRLARIGARKGIIVPVCVEKSLWTIVAVLGVAKTGAAFVLLDEDLPQERLRQLAQLIAHETIAVVASAAQQHRASLLGSAVVVVDSAHLREAEALEHNGACIQHSVEASDIIYVVFTSGTTGIPKAALIRHSNICFFASSVGELSDVSNSSRILALASYAYDVSLGNIFLALLSGACICIPSSWECKNDVARLVESYGVTHLQTTPSMSRLLHPAESRGLEVLDLCGEPCSEETLAKWRGSPTRGHEHVQPRRVHRHVGGQRGRAISAEAIYYRTGTRRVLDYGPC